MAPQVGVVRVQHQHQHKHRKPASQPKETFTDDFSSSDETKSVKAKFCREELARVGSDGIHQEFLLQLEFALAVDLGVHLKRATYLLEGDGILVGYCAMSLLPSFRLPVPQMFHIFCGVENVAPVTTCYFPKVSSLHLIPFCPFLFSPSHTPRRSHQLPLAFQAIVRVRMGLALTHEADGTFGRSQLPNVDALIRVYCQNNVRCIAFWYLRRKSVGWPRGRLSEGTMVL